MRSHAAAVAWEFRRRHRWGLIAVACYLLALAAFRLVILARGQPVTFDDEQTFAFTVVVPSATAFMYFLAVFSFGFAGDLAGRQSIYPTRLFTLPVTSGALAGWPMLYGTVGVAILWLAVAILWLATRFLAAWPSDLDVPLIWPALLAAVFLAWTQALTWMPYALPGLRVIVTVLMMIQIDVVVFVASYSEASETVMLAILAPNIPLAYLVARFAVSRARRGDVPDWSRIFARPGRLANLLPRRRGRFRSPAGAQAWFEWRRYGCSLPVLVGILLPFELSFFFLFRDTPVIVFETLLATLLTPPFMAVFVAATVSKPNLNGSDSYGVTPFIATRPLTSVSLVTAKLKVTIWSTLATWLLVIIAIPLALRLSGTSPLVIEWTRKLIEAVGTPRASAIVLLGFSALLASTWKQLVQSLYIGMSGRAWLVKGSVFLALSLLTLFVVLAEWVIRNGEVIAALWNALPWILAVLVCFKIFAAARIAMRLHDSRQLSDRTLILGAACWAIAVFALYGLLVWLLPTLLFRTYLLALVAILAIPLARLSAAPLALSWNRHR
jgi:hypothetical protein